MPLPFYRRVHAQREIPSRLDRRNSQNVTWEARIWPVRTAVIGVSVLGLLPWETTG